MDGEKRKSNRFPKFTVIWDKKYRGFGERIYDSGRKSWVMMYRANKKLRLLTLGDTLFMNRSRARENFIKAKVNIAEGKDPLEEKRAIKNQVTISDLCKQFIEDYSKVHKTQSSWKDDVQRFETYIKPAFGRKSVTAVTRTDVIALHKNVGKRGRVQANRVVDLLSAIINRGKVWGLVHENFPNPATRIVKYAETPRDRWVRKEEMPKLWEAIEVEEDIYVRTVFKLYLLTGMRKRELLNARWNDLDIERGVLKIPKTKTKTPYHKPITTETLKLLKALPRKKDNPYIFPGHKDGKPLTEIKRAWGRIRMRAGLPDVRIHDLRRTFGSWLLISSHSLVLVKDALNHKSIRSTEIYAHISDSHLRGAIDSVNDKMIAMAKGVKEAKIIYMDSQEEKSKVRKNA